MKEAGSKPPVLGLSNFSLLSQIECDALGKEIGAVLIQEGHPIVFFT